MSTVCVIDFYAKFYFSLLREPRSVSRISSQAKPASFLVCETTARFLRGKCHIFTPSLPLASLPFSLVFLSARRQIESHNYPSCVTPTFLRRVAIKSSAAAASTTIIRQMPERSDLYLKHRPWKTISPYVTRHVDNYIPRVREDAHRLRESKSFSSQSAAEFQINLALAKILITLIQFSLLYIFLFQKY